jgi:hypothetical protein
MAEASLLSQKAAVQEQENSKALLDLQKEENQLRKEELKHSIEESKLDREEHKRQMQLGYEERSCTTKLLQKMVERPCPQENPAEHYIARKKKLDNL